VDEVVDDPPVSLRAALRKCGGQLHVATAPRATRFPAASLTTTARAATATATTISTARITTACRSAATAVCTLL
jgi:hypothetical protein